MQFLEDRFSSCGPAKRLTARVVRVHEVIDALDQLLDAGERAAANGFVGDQAEEAFDLVQPRAVRGNEVHVPTRAGSQPGLDLGMAVGRVVVGNAVDVQFSRHRRVDLA